MTIGDRIKALRLEREWTRKKLAFETRSEMRPLGFSEQAIADWENGLYKPSERGIRALERAFGMKLRK